MPGAAVPALRGTFHLRVVMSIAVSAVIRPSRCLRLALAGHAAASLGMGLALLAGAPGNPRFPHLLALACLLAAGVAARAAASAKMTRRIDISGLGEIRLTVQQSMGSTPIAPMPMQLLPGSTVWPECLLLRLRAPEGGAPAVLLVLPDSVAPDEFRALAVAIRTIAGRDNKFFGANKIL